MADPLSQFQPPANCDDFLVDLEKRRRFRRDWSRTLNSLTQPHAGVGSNYYNPLVTPTGDARRVKVEWSAFPKTIEDDGSLGTDAKFERADERLRQNEYCEWIVERSPASGRLVRVIFTTELVEYWRALWAEDPNRVLDLYRELVSPRVALSDLDDGTGTGGAPGAYLSRNIWNTGGTNNGSGIVHMIASSPNNTLTAALLLVAGAANDADVPVPGGPFHADPLILVSVRRAVNRLNARISFSNPVGVYLQEPEFHRFELPASAPRDVHPADFWRVTRGFRPDGCAMRAEYSVPSGLGFGLEDLKIDGRPLRWGSQIARTLKTSTYVTPIPRP